MVGAENDRGWGDRSGGTSLNWTWRVGKNWFCQSLEKSKHGCWRAREGQGGQSQVGGGKLKNKAGPLPVKMRNLEPTCLFSSGGMSGPASLSGGRSVWLVPWPQQPAQGLLYNKSLISAGGPCRASV